jgi:hypothetical protein
VYEADLAKYEVMDGQQRITAIHDFYSNQLRLTGLEQWPELNNRTYSKLPSEIKKGIDRRAISYTVLLKESAETTEEQTAWGLPPFSESERINPPTILLESTFYSKMTDVEVVLRFFALRHADHYQRGMQGFLDLYMLRARRFTLDDISHLRTLFYQTIEFGHQI